MEALGINIGYLIIQILAFTILLILMKGWAYTPILNILEQRKARIAKGLEDARQAAIARDNADAEAKNILDAARAEAAKIRSEATVQAEETASGILGNARTEAKTIVENAASEAEEERNQILANLRSEVVAIAMAAANRIVDDSMRDEKRQRQIISGFLSEVPAGVAQLSGERAEVTSALPLTDDEKAATRKAIKAQEVSFRVDPAILGGLIVRVGDRVVDNSVAGKAATMREKLAA